MLARRLGRHRAYRVLRDQRSAAVIAALGTALLVFASAIGIASGATAVSARTTAQWRVSKVFPPASAGFFAVSCATSSACYAIGSYGTGASEFSLAATTDGGTSWRVATLPAGFAPAESGLGTAANDVLACPAARTCLIAGLTASSKPAVLATTDGGGHWKAKSLPAGLSVGALACPSSTTCYAVASAVNKNVVLRTTDGGTFWTSEATSTAPLTTISCSSTRSCGATGSKTGSDVFLVTSNGTTWTKRASPGSISGGDDIACPASKVCLVADGTRVLKTANSGLTWKTLRLPAKVSISSIACPSASRCEAVGSTGVAVVVGTSNGGASWKAQRLPRVGDGYFTAASDLVTTPIVACAGSSTCLVGGTASPLFADFYQFGFLLRTTNDGESWKQEVLPRGSDNVGAVSCLRATSSCEAAASSPSGLFLGTANGGTTWDVQAETIPTTGGSFRDVSCASTKVCVAVGVIVTGPTSSEGAVARTTDGGRHWKTLPITSAFSLSGVSCATVEVCVAVGVRSDTTGAIALRTTSGGARWSSEPIPVRAAQLSDVSCASITRCEAVGFQDGSLAIGTTNGKTWKRQRLPKSPVNTDLVGVACPTTSVCAAVGATLPAGGMLLFTVNGGANWKTQKVPAGAGAMTDVACASASRCEATAASPSGLKPVVLGTTDSGALWSRQALPGGVQSLIGLACPSTKVCYAAGTSTTSTGLLVKIGS